MKIKDMIAHLQTMEPEFEVLQADYYYDVLEGFIPMTSGDFKDMFCKPTDTSWHKNYPDNVYLFDGNGV